MILCVCVTYLENGVLSGSRMILILLESNCSMEKRQLTVEGAVTLDMSLYIWDSSK